MSTFVILQQMCVIALLVAIGAFLYKRRVIDDRVSRSISTIILDVCNPALILSSILTGNMTATHHELLVSMGLGVLVYAFLVGFGFIMPLILRVERDKHKYYNMMTVYTNIGFIGIPVAKVVLPDNAMLYVIVCNVIYCLLFYTHGVVLLSGGKEKVDLKRIFSPGTVMAVVTLLVFWFGIEPPAVISNTVVYVGNATTFLSMTLLGVAVARSDIREGIKDVRIYFYILIRMILMPLCIGLLLHLAHADHDMMLAFVLVMAMPVANMPLIQAEKTGEDTVIFSRSIMMSTLISLASITMVIGLVSAW